MKYKEWLDVWFANYIEPSSKTKTCERYSEIIEKHLKVAVLNEYGYEVLSYNTMYNCVGKYTAQLCEGDLKDAAAALRSAAKDAEDAAKAL